MNRRDDFYYKVTPVKRYEVVYWDDCVKRTTLWCPNIDECVRKFNREYEGCQHLQIVEIN